MGTRCQAETSCTQGHMKLLSLHSCLKTSLPMPVISAKFLSHLLILLSVSSFSIFTEGDLVRISFVLWDSP